MRRGFVPVVIVCVTALAAAAAVARPLRYRLTFAGSVTVTHTDQGLQANGSACGLGTPDDTSPFDDHYSLSLRWNVGFTVTLGRVRQTAAADVRLSGGQFSYGGYVYDYNCHEIAYGPGGQPCTGALSGGGRASLVLRSSPAHKPKRLSITSQPFGALTGTPASCTVSATPEVTYEAADELGLSTLGQTLAQTFKLGVPARARTLRYRLRRTSNCSQSPQSPGESDSCTTVYGGSGSLQVRPG
jgi:hypothetical protein